MKLFDTHFHYNGESSPAEYCADLACPELVGMIACGADFDESRKSQNFAEPIDYAWFAAGAHPHSATDYVKDISCFEEFKDHPKLVAVGEIGLDFFYEYSKRRTQYAVFERFLELALKWQLPAIVHCRDQENKFAAYHDCYTLLRDFHADKGKFVLHCFCGTPDWAEKFLELDAYLGITGIVTFPKADNVRETLKIIPDDRLLLETDSPYLAPVPYRGKTNHPGHIVEVAARVATERGSSTETIGAMTTANACRCFNLKNS